MMDLLNKANGTYGLLFTVSIAGISLLGVYGSEQTRTLPFFSTDTGDVDDDVFIAALTCLALSFLFSAGFHTLRPPHHFQPIPAEGGAVPLGPETRLVFAFLNTLYAITCLLFAISAGLALEETFNMSQMFDKPLLSSARAVQAVIGFGAFCGLSYNVFKAKGNYQKAFSTD
jgi:hypothetical protein